VIVNPIYRGKGVGTYLINIMEKKAISKYNVNEIHISCFNQNVTGLLLYYKLGYVPYEIEKRYDKKSLPVALIKMKKQVQDFLPGLLLPQPPGHQVSWGANT
jgi:ribosomal protein S18 acetylase RimI-like enzyme